MIKLLFAFTLFGHAAIPPTWFIVKKAVEKRATFSGAQINSVFSEYSDGAVVPIRFRESLTVDPKSGLIQGRISDDAGTEVYVFEKTIEQFRWNLVYQLFFEKEYEPYLKWLSAHKIPFKTPRELSLLANETQRKASEKTTLKRLNGQIAWAVGVQQSTPSPQIWFQKDAFVPLFLKLINSQKSSSKVLSYTFSQYRYFKEIPYPNEITIEVEGEPGIRSNLTQFNPGPTPTLSKLSTPGGYTARGLELHPAEKILIETYLARLR